MKILTELEVRELEGRYRKLIIPFCFDDDLLGVIEVPAGFVCDYESVPIIMGSSKRAGVAHDYLYRINSTPVVPKAVADLVYLRMMKLVGVGRCRRIIKYNAVRLFGGSSYHKLRVETTYKQIKEKR